MEDFTAPSYDDPHWWADTHSEAWGAAKARLQSEWLMSHNLPWAEAERAVRFGYGAGHHYDELAWTEELALTLHSDWDVASGDDSSWSGMREAVMWGWQAGTADRLRAR